MASPSGFLCGTITIFWALEKIDLTVAISTEFMRPNIQYYTKVLGSPFLFLAPGTLPIRIFLGSREPGPFLRGALLDKDHGMDGPGFKIANVPVPCRVESPKSGARDPLDPDQGLWIPLKTVLLRKI